MPEKKMNDGEYEELFKRILECFSEATRSNGLFNQSLRHEHKLDANGNPLYRLSLSHVVSSTILTPDFSEGVRFALIERAPFNCDMPMMIALAIIEKNDESVLVSAYAVDPENPKAAADVLFDYLTKGNFPKTDESSSLQ